MKKSLLFPIFAALCGILTACEFPFAESASSQADNLARKQGSANLVALFLVKKDNLRNQFRGEIYPIALSLNGSYVDVSNDVTREVRENFQENRLLEVMRQHSFLSAVKNFVIINQGQKLGDFKVNNLALSQFACSSMITGQGDFASETSLPQLYTVLPAKQSGGFKGSIGNKQFDESWRWTIATSRYRDDQPTARKQTPEAEIRYQQDLITSAKTLMAQSPEVQKQSVIGPEVLEQSSVQDLNHDGSPEVFGIVRKGDPKNSGRNNAIAYTNLWLDYSNGQPRVLSSELQMNTLSAKPPYTLVDILDINGDGVDEVIVQNNGYESVSFSILEYNNNQLQPVFSGAGYGC
jgi:hypothetical protein